MHGPSLMRSLTHRADSPTAVPFAVAGWRRTWDVVSARTFVPTDQPDGTIHRRLVLGITQDDTATCEGVLLDLSAPDLDALALREAAYVFCPIVGRRETERLRSYVPHPKRRLAFGPVEEPLVVEGAYLRECLDGAEGHGLTKAAAELAAALGDLRIADAIP